MEGGKPENPKRNPRSKEENQQQTQPTNGAGSGNRTRDTLVGGERSYHCAIPAPLNVNNAMNQWEPLATDTRQELLYTYVASAKRPRNAKQKTSHDWFWNRYVVGQVGDRSF